MRRVREGKRTVSPATPVGDAHGRRLGLAVALGCIALAGLALGGCSDQPWNSPWPPGQHGEPIVYSSFRERPKHLDPARSYSSNEAVFTAQIYEPPLQYHYLARPYRLVPLTATRMPAVRYLDQAGGALPEDAEAERIARSVYEIRIRPGVRYQPHPAFARDARGELRYHRLDAAALESIHVLGDFERTGTRELVAADYVYQVKRLAHPQVHSPIGGLMRGYIDGLAELGEALEQALPEGGSARSFLDLREFELAGAEVVDRYTFRISIRGKYPQFVYWLAMPFFAPMPWEADRFYAQPGLADKNISLDWYPVGTGPFMLVENNPNLRMVLERNPNFRGEPYPSAGLPDDADRSLLADAGETMPFVSRAVYSLEKEAIPYWNKFLQGYYDTSGVSSDSFDQAIEFTDTGSAELTDRMRERGIALETAVATSILYTGFNWLDPVLGGDSERARKLRQAISIAIDYEEFVSIFRNGRGLPAQGPLPPGIFGNRSGRAGINPYVYDWVDGRPRRKPIEAARRLMAEAGYPDGRDARTGKPLVLHLDTPLTGPDAKSRLDWMRKQLARLDIQLVVRATDYNRFQDKMRKGTSQIYQWGWNADYPDPENFLFLLHGDQSKVANGGENASNYVNPDFDRLFEQMKNMDNGPSRQAIIDEMVAIARRDAPWVWGYHPKDFTLHHAWYRNFHPNLMANNTLKYVRVDPELRARKRVKWNDPVVWPVYTIAILILLALLPGVLTVRRKERATAR